MDDWLDHAEQRAWRSLAAVILKLPAELEQALQRDAGLSHIEYWVMALLSEAPERRLQLRHLAAQANASLSRLSHVVTRLDRRGFVVREPVPEDARATFAVLTDEGQAQVEAAAPGHVATVRALVFDGLSDQDVGDLERLCVSIAGRLDQRRPV